MKKYISLFLAASLLAGCSSSDLDQEPSNAISYTTALESAENVKAVLTGAYDQTGHFWYLTLGQIGLDVMGDDAMVTNGAFGFSTYNWQVYSYNYIQYPRNVDGWWSNYCDYMWRRAYMAIDQCNLIIENADNLPSGCEDYLAQAHGLRAWNFMNLYHLFCPAYNNPSLGGDNGKGLFLRLTAASADKSTNVQRSNLKESIDQIISDLEYAYENCTSTSNYYINQHCAALLLARMYLEISDYTNASKYAEIAADNTFDGSNLMSADDYQAGFMTANSEWLWGFHFDGESTNIYASLPSFYHTATTMDANAVFGTAAYGTKVPGSSVSEQIAYLEANATDYMTGYSTIRFAKSFVSLFSRNADSIWTDCRALFPFYIDSKDGYFTSKFNQNGSLGIADYPMARIAEAYLIEAEAQYRLGNSTTALEVLNALQNKRNGTVSTEVNIDEIWKERRRELYGEGFAITDIKRLCKPLERTGEDQWSSVLTLPANSNRMMYPIPDAELNYNPYYSESDEAYNEGQNDYWAK
ncbi:MAG: RagB/SusD family nutrient uptake outer membrane protein [Prevotella sp.]|jgi:hypothetical protein